MSTDAGGKAALDDGSDINAEALLSYQYLLAKLAMVIPLFQEARDALTAIREDQRILHGISKTLADRMDIAGTFSLNDWLRDFSDAGGTPMNGNNPNQPETMAMSRSDVFFDWWLENWPAATAQDASVSEAERCTRLAWDAAIAVEREKWHRLYAAVNELIAHMGYHGSAEARGDRAQAVMDALATLDGGHQGHNVEAERPPTP